MKQSTSALSSTEAEVIGELACCKSGMSMRFFAGELVGRDPKSLPRTLHRGDNLGALKFAREGATSSKLKHIALAHLRMGEWTDEGHFDFQEVRSSENRADFYTKLMGALETARHRSPYYRRVAFL